MHDVIVVGGGPSGSQVARRLSEKGCRVLVLERKERAGEKVCCTGIVSRECIEAFGIDESVVLRSLNSATFFSPSGDRLRLYRKETQAVVLDRAACDVAMAERAQRAGAEYRFNHRVTDIAIESDRAVAAVSYRDRVSKIPARVAVIASGFAPGWNERLGLGAAKDYVAGVQAEAATPGLEETEVYFGDIAPGFFGWLVPAAPGMGRAGLMTRREPGAYLKRWLAYLAERGKIASADVKVSYGGIPLKPPPRTCGERMIAVGDAAGQVKPMTGGGIYYGLLCADIAAETLHRALAEDDFSAKGLSRYERAWRKKLGGELRTGYRARKLFERLSEGQIDRLFKIIKSAGIDEAMLKAEDLSFDWHGRTIMRLLKYRMVTKYLEIVMPPTRSGRIDR